MKGKQRCKILKEIRQKIADANDIEFITSECQHKGDCLGTCPKCEAELKYLERELEKRQRLGKAVVVAGLSAVIATSALGCDDWSGNELGGDPLPSPDEREEIVLDGDIAATESPIDLPQGLPEDTKGLLIAPDEIEIPGESLPPDDCVEDVLVDGISADELKAALTGGVTREGLYNSHGWAELFVSTDENGNDLYICPIEGYKAMTIIYEHEDNGGDFIVDVQFHAEDSAVVLPEDDLS